MKHVEVPDIPARQLVLWTLGVTAVIVCFWLLFHFQTVVLLLLTAMILSTAVLPAVRWLEKHNIAKPAGILIVFGLFGLLVGVLLWLTLPLLAAQGAMIGQSLDEGYQFLRQSLQRLPNIFLRRLLIVLPLDLSTFAIDLEVNGVNGDLTETLMQSRRLLMSVFHLIAIGLLTFYWTLEGERLKQAAFLIVPLPKRNVIREFVQDIETKVSSYLLGQGMLCLIIGGLAFIAYMLIGLPNALLLAIFAGLLEAVPILGPFLGAVPAIIVGLSVSPLTALWVILASIVIQQLENILLVPRVMNRTIGVRPFVTLLALLVFGSLFGVLGALIALPLAAVIQLLLDRFLLGQGSLEQAENSRNQLSVLRYQTNQLAQDVRSQIRHKLDVPSAATDELEDEVEAIALDLERFLAAEAGDMS
ncbi:MAG: AI-2E family transporter [Anaerolinea sp.]|nr:AI-2E family transporter [Anaerolinea sp.]